MWPRGLGHRLDMSWYRTAAHREAEGVGWHVFGSGEGNGPWPRLESFKMGTGYPEIAEQGFHVLLGC